MRKKLALLLAAIMVIGMIPMTAFATTTNRMTKVVTGKEDTVLKVEDAPVLRIYEKDLADVTTGQAFELQLTNAEWASDAKGADKDYAPLARKIEEMSESVKTVKITELTSKNIIVKVQEFVYQESDPKKVETDSSTEKATINVPMWVKLTDEGTASVSIDPRESVISSGTYTFATVGAGSATVTVEKKKDVSESGDFLKNIVIKETAAGSLEDGDIKLKLTSDWNFKKVDFSVYPDRYAEYFEDAKLDKEEAIIKVDGLEALNGNTGSDEAITISISAKVEWDEDEVDPGDICEMTVSGAGIDKTTLEVATAVTYGVTWEAEDKTLPVFYSGSADNDDDTLKVTLEETVAASWLTGNNGGGRKTKIVFPEGVKVLGVDATKKDNLSSIEYTIDNKDGHGEVKITGEKVKGESAANGGDTTKAEFKFQLSVAPNFTGDITATLTGAAVDEEITAVVGTAVAPVTVTAESTDAKIDYRKTDIGDITITEAEAGVLEKDTTLELKIDKLGFDDDPTVEVVSGDLKIDSVKTDDNIVKIKIASESSKEPAVIKLTNCNLYMERQIPAGTYALKLTTSKEFTFNSDNLKPSGTKLPADTDVEIPNDDKNAIFKNSVTDGSTYDGTPLFDVRNVTVVKDYVNVVTAGRDVDDSTFTTQLKVTIGASEMYANDKAIALDVPAYISNGYTMLPVRAVTEALSGTAIVRWDDPSHTVTITFGSRVVNMTVGSNIMVINGVDVPMQAKCEITDSRAFIPLRDMGYALGLNDSKINWDDATKTATLN